VALGQRADHCHEQRRDDDEGDQLQDDRTAEERDPDTAERPAREHQQEQVPAGQLAGSEQARRDEPQHPGVHGPHSSRPGPRCDRSQPDRHLARGPS
jgi:hypothetical protein